ncbi:conserved hypothetical protein [Histoplasma capsulatum var. duboisii H88]|uniref:Uncharacterized protein n=1 Tax=Ajellomyces capsulatus (strain H88) TaxID=544711 RepID=F0UIH9_AJEC8|nr:conserved hypothetical protein [Histoplasma capsulatum var. duboisii H88]
MSAGRFSQVTWTPKWLLSPSKFSHYIRMVLGQINVERLQLEQHKAWMLRGWIYQVLVQAKYRGGVNAMNAGDTFAFQGSLRTTHVAGV